MKKFYQLRKVTEAGDHVFTVATEDGELAYAIEEFYAKRRGVPVSSRPLTGIDINGARKAYRERMRAGYVEFAR